MDFGAFDENVKERFHRFIAASRKKSNPGKEFCTLENYIEMYDLILGKRINDKHFDIRKKHWWKFQTSNLMLFSLGMLVIQFHTVDGAPNPIAYEEGEFNVDPNIVVQNLISQIANHSLGSLRLSQDGLESSARVMNRTLEEHGWLLLALIYDREKLRIYINEYNDLVDAKKAKRIWRDHFSPKQLLTSMEKIESTFKDDANSILKNSESRKTSYSTHSGAVHGNFVANMLLSYGSKEEGDGEFALFGSRHFSTNSLDRVAANICDIYLRLFPMLRVVHKFNISDYEPWSEFIEISTFAVMLNLNIKFDEERHDLIKRVFTGPLPFEEQRENIT